MAPPSNDTMVKTTKTATQYDDLEIGLEGHKIDDRKDVDTSTSTEATTTTDNTSTTTTPQPNISNEAEAIPESSLKQTAMNGFAGLGFVSSFISMMSEYSATAIQHPAILISGCLGIILSPYAKFQQEKLTQVKALQQTNDVLENELVYLKEQNEAIQKHVAEISSSTTKLQTLQSTLSYLQTNQNATSIQQLEQQVEESKQILSQCKQSTKAVVLQNLISILIQCDNDHTMTLNDTEIDKLIQSLESIHNVQIKEDKVRQLIISNNRSITSIMEIARNVILNTTTSSSAAAAALPPPTTTKTDSLATESVQGGNNIESIFSFIES